MHVHVCAEDVGTTDHCLIWTEGQQTRAKRNRWGRKLYKWRIDKLEMEEKQQEFQEKMAKNAVKFSKLLKSVGPVDTEMKGSGRNEDCRGMGIWSRTQRVKSWGRN